MSIRASRRFARRSPGRTICSTCPSVELFAALAVFTGGATIDAVEDVCNADLDVLTSLFDKSLVRRTGARVWMLETVREFASEQLAADPTADEIGDRHADHYLTLAESWDRELRGPGQTEALEGFTSERENVRAAVERLLDRDSAKALRLVAALGRFMFMRGQYQEGRELLAAALEQAPTEATEARASALVRAGLFATEQGDNQVALGLLEEGLACSRAAGSTASEAHALSMLAFFSKFGKDEQIRLGEEAIAEARASGDLGLLGTVIGNHGSVMGRLGDNEKATALTEEAYRLARSIGDVYLEGLALSHLAADALEKGDSATARTRLNESLELAQLIENTRGISFALADFGWLALLEGDLVEALSFYEEATTIAKRLGVRSATAYMIWGLAQVAAANGDADRAARLAGAAAAYGSAAKFDPTDSMPSIHHLDAARAALGDRAWQTAWTEGAQLDLDTALELASGLDPS